MLCLGDADCILVSRWRDGLVCRIMVDGGKKRHAPYIKSFLRRRRISTIDHVVCSHSDKDHAGGLIELVNDGQLDIGQAWVHRPERNIDLGQLNEALEATSDSGVSQLLLESLNTQLTLLQSLADQEIPVEQPFTGRRIGFFAVCGPTREYYKRLLARFKDVDSLRMICEQAEAEHEQLGETAWLAALDEEQPNLRAAAAWAREAGRLEIGLRLAVATWRHDLRGGLGDEAMTALAGYLAHPAFGNLPSALRAQALNAAGGLALLMDLPDAADGYLRTAASLLTDRHPARLRKMVLHNLGSILMVQGDLDGARSSFELALTLTEPGSERFQAMVERNLAILALMRSDPRAVLDWLDRSETFFLRAGDPYGLALCLTVRGQAEFRLGRGALARRALDDAAERFRAAGDARRELEALCFLADAALHDLDLEAATAALERAAAVEAQADDRSHSTVLAILVAKRDLLADDAAKAAEHLRRLRMTVDASMDAVLLSMVDLEHAWALAALGLREEGARLAGRALALDRRHGRVADHTIAVLEAVARSTASDCGPRWLAELGRIRVWAGLPRMALQTVRCGYAAPDVATDDVAGEPADWRSVLDALREEMAEALPAG